MPDETLRLRRARLEDATVLPEIEWAAGAAFAEAGHPELAAMEAISVAEALEAIEAGEVTVAEIGTKVVGFLLIDPSGEERLIDEISVLPECQRQGVGSRLVREAVLDARRAGCETVILNTQDDVSWNRPWYERRGFQVVAEAQWTEQMAQVTRAQREAGLDWKTRVHMRKRC